VVLTSAADAPKPGDWSGVSFASGSGGCSGRQWSMARQGLIVMKRARPCFTWWFRSNANNGIVVHAFASGCSGGYAAPAIGFCEIYGNGANGVSYAGAGSSFSGCTMPKTGVVVGAITNSVVHHNGGGIYVSAWDGYWADGYAAPVIRVVPHLSQRRCRHPNGGRRPGQRD